MFSSFSSGDGGGNGLVIKQTTSAVRTADVVQGAASHVAYRSHGSRQSVVLRGTGAAQGKRRSTAADRWGEGGPAETRVLPGNTDSELSAARAPPKAPLLIFP